MFFNYILLRKNYEIGFCEAEILYLNFVCKNELTVEFTTKDPTSYPIFIYGVDIFARRKDDLKLNDKYNTLYSLCEQEQSSMTEDAINDVIQELLQSDNIPALVNWKEKFESTEKLLNKVDDKTDRDQKRLLFYLSEAAAPTIEHMTEKQIENELFYHINPLIGEYICKVEDKDSKSTTYSKLVLESLTRLLKQCLEKLNSSGEKPRISITKR